MKSRNVIILLVAVVAVITLFYSFQDSQDEGAYVAQIEKEREEKDRFMRTSSESPFASAPESYAGLNYYPHDVNYRIVANLQPVQEKKPIVLATNDGKEQRYFPYAWAEFKLDGSAQRLLILEMADMGPMRGKLFLAFCDETSAGETYGGGRY